MISRKKIIELLNFKTEAEWIVSFYMGVGVYKAKRKAYEIEAKDVMKKALGDTGLSADDRKGVEDDIKRILNFLKMDFRGKAKGLGIFSCKGAGLWQVFRLPVTVPDRCVIDRYPFVLPMLKIVDESKRYCVVVADKEKARVFTMYLGEITERTDIFDIVPGWHKQGGWAQARFQRHIEDHVNRHLKHVADTVWEFHKKEGFGHIILGGAHEIRARLYRILHSYLQTKVAGYITVDVTSSADDVLKAAGEIEKETEERASREIAGALLNLSRQTYTTVTGLKDTVRALKEGRVHTLVLVDNYEIQGCLCGDCGNADILGTKECSDCGKKLSEVDDISEHLAILAVERDAEVKYIGRGLGLDASDGVGAILRW